MNNTTNQLIEKAKSLYDTVFWGTSKFIKEGAHEEIIFTAILFLVGAISLFLIKSIAKKHKKWSHEEKRKFVFKIRNLIWLVGVTLTLLIWSKDIMPFIVSLAVFFVAFVTATKEWILCLIGYIYRASSSPFRVGDRILINKVRGEVIDVQWLQTRVFELGPTSDSNYYTGKVLSFPNSWFLQFEVTNETFFNDYNFHWIKIPLTTNDQVETVLQILIKEANEICKDFLNEAKLQMKQIQKSHFMDSPSLSPIAHIEFTQPGSLLVHLRFPSPSGKSDEMAQKIVTNFLKAYKPSIDKKWSTPQLIPAE